jgi:hypothetical protein
MERITTRNPELDRMLADFSVPIQPVKFPVTPFFGIWLAGRKCCILHGSQLPRSALLHEYSGSNHLDHCSVSGLEGIHVRENGGTAIDACLEILLLNIGYQLPSRDNFQEECVASADQRAEWAGAF